MKPVTAYQAFSIAKRERVTLVVTRKPDGMLNIMSASWNMKCSSRPPLFAVAMEHNNYSRECIEHHGEFVVALANQQMVELVELAGSTSGRTVDKFKEVSIRTLPVQHVSLPLLADATINFECVLRSVYPAGDHSIYIGEIHASHLHDRQRKTLLTMEKVNNHRTYHEL